MHVKVAPSANVRETGPHYMRAAVQKHARRVSMFVGPSLVLRWQVCTGCSLRQHKPSSTEICCLVLGVADCFRVEVHQLVLQSHGGAFGTSVGTLIQKAQPTSRDAVVHPAFSTARSALRRYCSPVIVIENIAAVA